MVEAGVRVRHGILFQGVDICVLVTLGSVGNVRNMGITGELG
jgi:hypothetical protein